MEEVHLFRALNAYLAIMFLAGLAQSLQFYFAVIGLIKMAAEKWPRLVRLVGQHSLILVTPGLLWPLAVSLVLMILQFMASVFIWPKSDGLLLGQIHGVYRAVLLPIGMAMVGWDLVRILKGNTLEPGALEPYLVLAEKALHPGTVALGKTLSFGQFNPVVLVSTEVKRHLSEIDQSLRASLWMTVTSLLLRGLFATTLWLSFAAT